MDQADRLVPHMRAIEILAGQHSAFRNLLVLAGSRPCSLMTGLVEYEASRGSNPSRSMRLL